MTIKRTPEGRWGIYEDGACVGAEDSEHLARSRAEGRDTAYKAMTDKGFTEEEMAYMRGQWSMLRRAIYPFGIVPEGEG